MLLDKILLCIFNATNSEEAFIFLGAEWQNLAITGQFAP